MAQQRLFTQAALFLMQTKYYDEFISLGLTCETASKIRQLCNTYRPLFYNWAQTDDIAALTKSLGSGPDLLLSETEPFKANMFLFKEYGMAFHGRVQFSELAALPKDESQRILACAENEVIERLAYMRMKFYEQKRSGHKVLFILKAHARALNRCTDIQQDLQALLAALDATFANLFDFDLLFVTPKSKPVSIAGTDRLHHRMTKLAPLRHALTRDNNADWIRDLFAEFRLKHDTKFRLLTHAASQPENAIDLKGYDLSDIVFDTGHDASNFLQVLEKLSPPSCLRVLAHYQRHRHQAPPSRDFDALAGAICYRHKRYLHAARFTLRARMRR